MTGDWFDTVLMVVFAMLCIALALAFIRLVLGPSVADRVVALELIASLTVAFIATYAISSGQPAFLDVAIVLALIAFLAAVGFARYLEKGERRQ